MEFTVKQKASITITTETPAKRELESTLDETTVYTANASSWEDLDDPEVAMFEEVQDEINFQYHKGNSVNLIVWFHGNGEGDLQTKDTNNNAAQMLANRGTVAWMTEEAQEVFGDASVIAFQSPDMWYLATKNDYLSVLKKEIDKVAEEDNISDIYVAGCSAGGYMSTRMVITYPDLFKAAMITCPALDISSLRNVQVNGNATPKSLEAMKDVVGAAPTDEELKALKDSKTAIWLVQAETDSSVNSENCSKRIWNALTDGEAITSKECAGEKGIASGFTTNETSDGKYKLTLYKTVDVADKVGTLGDMRPMGKIVCVEDYNNDGEYEAVTYNDQWSWVYTLRNNPEAKDGTHIWQWAKTRDLLFQRQS